jgi:nicotinamide phosphoribosyltransferase
MTNFKVTNRNPILDTDSYKLSHFKQYPPGTTEVSAYIEARPGAAFDSITFFGLQMFLKEKLAQKVATTDVYDAEALITAHMPGVPFNRAGWDTVVNELGGVLPIEVIALPEGMTVPAGTPLVQLRNTDPRFPWLTTYIETAMLRGVWYPSTVATQSREAKKVIYAGLRKTSDDPDGQIPFKLHDFGARGTTSAEQAGIGGAAHLVNFMGTDTLEALVYAKRYYSAAMPGYSIAAAEHSTITSWGRDGEADAYANMVKTFGGEGKLVAVVSDSYDIRNAVSALWGGKLKSLVTETGGTVVIRPDSGDPVETPVWVMQELARAFGATKNAKGYLVLNPSVRIIQGDGMNLGTIKALAQRVIDAGFAIDNIAFGMGGGLLQKLDRDTMRFAMKANEAIVRGARRDVSKSPVTDKAKSSKAGRVKVIRNGDERILTVREDDPAYATTPNLLQPVWRDGKLLKDWTFDQVRAHAQLADAEIQKAA